MSRQFTTQSTRSEHIRTQRDLSAHGEKKNYYIPLKKYQAPNTFNKHPTPIIELLIIEARTKYPLSKPPILWLICSFNWLPIFCREHTHSSLYRSLLTFLLKSTQTTNKHPKKNLQTSIKSPLIQQTSQKKTLKPSIKPPIRSLFSPHEIPMNQR